MRRSTTRVPPTRRAPRVPRLLLMAAVMEAVLLMEAVAVQAEAVQAVAVEAVQLEVQELPMLSANHEAVAT